MAAVRARESARPDAAFSDPLAARLAGERGRELAASMPLGSVIGFPWSWFKAVAPAAFRRIANRTYGYVLFEAI